MTGPVLALRAAILARLSADTALATLMGGAVRLHDEASRGAEPVYAVFGTADAKDWSSDGSRGHEQAAAVVVYAKPGSALSGVQAAERIAELLDDASLALLGHRLVALRVVAFAADRDESSNLARATVHLRAVTEVV
jgi:Protein of unknown function (DUF3168)